MNTHLKNFFAKITLLQLIVIVAVLSVAALSFAGVIHAGSALPLLPMVGAIKIRDSEDLIRTIKYTHSALTVTDTVYLLGGRPMLAMNSVAANVVNVYLAQGLIEYTTDTGTAWTSGSTVYWDNTNFRFTTTVGSNTKCGIVAEDKASAAATGFIILQIIV